ncbi:MAG: hypothetical protein ACOC4Y_02355 [bacterium]
MPNNKPYKQQTYRYYDKEKYFDFQDKLNRSELSFHEFVSRAINDYLEEEYNPKND